MDAAVQAFKDKTAEKAAAKQKSLAAVGEAKLAEHEGRTADAERAWATVAEYGMEGIEGECHKALQAMADAYVAANPERFVMFEEYVTPEGNDHVVKAISVMSTAGMEEAALELTMFERAKFERVQRVGATVRAVTKPARNGD